MTPEEGLEKSALLLLTLGPDGAAEVLKHLGPREVQKLGMKMATMAPQPRSKVEQLLDELDEHAGKGGAIHADEEAIREMLTKALGDERAAHLLSRVLQGSDTAGIESLKWMDAPTAADLIKNEHPQIIATILVHLEFDQAGEILKYFPERLRNDVVLRIATLDGVQPQALKELNDALTRMLSGASSVKKAAMGGVRHAAEILNFVGSAAETAVIDNVREYDPDLAQRILDEMFVFENLMDIDDRGIQTILREVQSDSLIVALKGAAPDLREKIFKNMSSRAAEMLREDLEAKGPVRLSEVEAEQKEILKIVRRLAEEGQIMLGGKGGDDAFV
ncbi:flagellar motor switch protein FliG [Pseudothauera nasutitermitis]|uniref:Flagellar motor switch protein FliG n=1 Tax=Pseudothauera nasutitermitis TaxID=2565930 RepID=A0A4S4B0J1_9RHOO|nr:flagellar motor switch protein FliG [Pseudothauera nasutitermitis]THF65971.1 flagellar motor switch protein FliG [Pseudothauera nasutitermitis]